MTTTLAPALVSPTQPARQVLGVLVDVYLDTAATGGQYTAYVCTVPPEVGPPPHRHEAFDEAFFVIEGQIEVLLAGERKVAGPGTYVFIPRGEVHTFRNVGDSDAKMLGTATPSGHERFFEEADAMAREGNPGLEDVLALCARNGIEVVLG